MLTQRSASPGIGINLSTRTIKDAATAKVIDDLVSVINAALSQCVSPNYPSAPLVASPSGFIYAVSVSDAGVVSATLVRKP